MVGFHQAAEGKPSSLVRCTRCGFTWLVGLPPQVEQVRAMVALEINRARVAALEAGGKEVGLTRAELVRQRTDLGLLWGGKKGGG